jgi:hypothetical protein
MLSNNAIHGIGRYFVVTRTDFPNPPVVFRAERRDLRLRLRLENTPRFLGAAGSATGQGGTAAGDPMGLEPSGGCPTGNPCSTHRYTETITALRDGYIWVNTFAAKVGGRLGSRRRRPLTAHTAGSKSTSASIGRLHGRMARRPIPDSAVMAACTVLNLAPVYTRPVHPYGFYLGIRCRLWSEGNSHPRVTRAEFS